MSLLWSYFWPVLGAGLLFGIVSGAAALRRRKIHYVVAGAMLTLAAMAVWNGPIGAARKLSVTIERSARATLDDFEMVKVRATLHHRPLTRRLLLSGPADDFQHSELIRIMSAVPGVSRATWSNEAVGVPLIVESTAVSILGFLLGLLLAYGVELRRRYNAQWKW